MLLWDIQTPFKKTRQFYSLGVSFSRTWEPPLSNVIMKGDSISQPLRESRSLTSDEQQLANTDGLITEKHTANSGNKNVQDISH